MQPSLGSWGLVLGVAAAIRLVTAFWIFGDMPLQSDAASYAAEAQALLDPAQAGRPYFWPPGTSHLLAATYELFGVGLATSRAFATSLGILWVAAVALLAREASREPDLSLVAAWVAALYPPSVLMAGQTYSQALVAVCLTGSAWAMLRLARGPTLGFSTLCGCLLGLAVLVRPSSLSVLAFFTLAGLVWAWMAMRSGNRSLATRRLVATVYIAFLAVALMLPAMRHNASHGAGWSLSTNNEWNLLVGNNPYTPHYKTSHHGQRPIESLPHEVRRYFERLHDDPEPRTAMRDAALEYMVENPGVTALRTLNRIRAFWGFDYIMSRTIQNHFGFSSVGLASLLVFEAGGYFLVMLLGLIGFIRTYSDWEFFTWGILLGVVLAYQAPYTVAFSSGTYHFPVMGLVIPFTAAGLRGGITAFQLDWSRRDRRIPLIVCSAAFVLVQVEYAWFTWQYV